MTVALTTYPSARNDANEDRWSTMMRRLFTDGVHGGTSDTNEFRPYGDSTGMQVKSDTGATNISGFYAEAASFQTLALAAADGTNPRIDRLILRLDRTSPVTIYLAILTGSPSSSPTAPALTVNSTTVEIPLGRIAVGAGVSTITSTNVTDERVYCTPQSALPAGTVLDYLGSIAPAGYLLLAGQTGLSIVTYPALAQAMGITSGTITLPDCRGRFSRGANGDLLGTGGAASTVLTAAQIPALPHNHNGPGGIQYIVGSVATSTIFTNQGSNIDHAPAWNISASSPSATADANSAAAGTPVPTVPLYLAMNKIVKAY